MIVSELSPPALRRHLAAGTLRLRTGAVVIAIRSRLKEIEAGVSLLYASHELADDDGFADFRVSVDEAGGWRGGNAEFRFDGEPAWATRPASEAFALLEWGLTRCVVTHCHQYLMIHAAVLERNGVALLMPAAAGSGKSTLGAALCLRSGWRLMSDELALLEPTAAHVIPLPRPLTLRNESIDLLRHVAPQIVVGRVTEHEALGRVAHASPPAQPLPPPRHKVRPAWVVQPRYVPGSSSALSPASKAHTFMALVHNAVNYDVHGKSGFDCLGNVVDRCGCFTLDYGDVDEATSLLDRLAGPSA